MTSPLRLAALLLVVQLSVTLVASEGGVSETSSSEPLPSLLQPKQPETKSAPIGTPEKAVRLLAEMNQKWEGMDSPNAENNPWDSVSTPSNGAGVFRGPGSKLGTADDPYTPRFGTWKHPPRAVPPPQVYKTFLFDPNHPFRRKMPEPPSPQQDVDPKLWHPLQGAQGPRFRDRFPQVVLPVPKPAFRRGGSPDKWGMYGRKPRDWTYERIPARPLITRASRPARQSTPDDINVNYEYPHFSVVNPRSTFKRRYPSNDQAQATPSGRRSFLETGATVTHIAAAPAQTTDDHVGPADHEVIVPPHAQASAPFVSHNKKPSLIEEEATTSEHHAVQHHAVQQHAVQHHTRREAHAARTHVPRTRATLAHERTHEVDNTKDYALSNALKQFNRGFHQPKAQAKAQPKEQHQEYRFAKAVSHAKPKAKNDDLDPTTISLDGPSDPDGILDAVKNDRAEKSGGKKSSHEKVNSQKVETVTTEGPVFVAVQEKETGMFSPNGGLIRVRPAQPKHQETNKDQPSLVEVKTEAKAEAKAEAKTEARAKLTFDKEEDPDALLHLAKDIPHPPVLMQYELALTPDPSVHPTAPNQNPVPPKGLNAAPVPHASPVAPHAAPQPPVLAEVASKVQTLATVQSEDEPVNLVVQHKLRLESETKKAKEEADRVWKASEDSKHPFWERPAALLENDERMKKSADQVGIASNQDNQKPTVPIAVEREPSATSGEELRFASIPSHAKEVSEAAPQANSDHHQRPSMENIAFPSPVFAELRSNAQAQLPITSAPSASEAEVPSSGYAPPDFVNYHRAEPVATAPALPFLPPGSNPQAPLLQQSLPQTLQALQQQQVPMFIQELDRARASSTVAPLASNVNSQFLMPAAPVNAVEAPVPGTDNPFAELHRNLMQQRMQNQQGAPAFLQQSSTVAAPAPQEYAQPAAPVFLQQQQQQYAPAAQYAPQYAQYSQYSQQQAPAQLFANSNDFQVRDHPQLPPIVLI